MGTRSWGEGGNIFIYLKEARNPYSGKLHMSIFFAKQHLFFLRELCLYWGEKIFW